MKLRRRELLKAGAVGVAGVLPLVQAGCKGKSEPASPPAAAPTTPDAEAAAAANAFPILIRGLSLIEYQKASKQFVVHLLDAAKLGMPAHEARLSVALARVDQDATSLDPTRKENVGTNRETWIWDINGKSVSVLDDANTPDADIDPSNPPSSQERPIAGVWKAMRWIPNVLQLTGATKVTSDMTNFVCHISLKHGRMQGEKPKGRVGNEAVWTIKRPSSAGGAVITKQAYSDTVRYTRPLGGRTPVVTIGGGKVVLRQGGTGDVVFENAAPPPATSPGSTITLGHFPLFYKVVDAAYEPEATPNPTSLPSCAGCEGDPVFCPPSWASI